MRIAFNDLRPQYRAIRAEIQAAIDEVFASGQFILGTQGIEFEQEFADYCGAAHGVGLASGTDALWLGLTALGAGPGSEVITVSNTALPTVAAITKAGATPVLVDVAEDGYHMDPAHMERAITARTKVIIPVHLYGQPAAMAEILAVARAHGIGVLEDCCQAHGAEYRGKKVGALGDAGAFSFYPTKNLGAYGDGGMVVTNDASVADRLRLLRDYGQRGRYHHVVEGYNSRLDELQAAILRVKLRYLDLWNEARRHKASLYTRLLKGVAKPMEVEGGRGVFHLYVIRVGQREALRGHMADNGVGTAVHYPTPVHRQEAYAWLGQNEGALPVSERLAREVLSLPLYPELPDDDVVAVADLINSFGNRTN